MAGSPETDEYGDPETPLPDSSPGRADEVVDATAPTAGATDGKPTEKTSGRDREPRPWPRGRLAVLARALAAVLGGLLVYLSAPPRELWWLAPLGVGLGALAVHGRRARAGFGYGVLFGLSWTLPLLVWLWDFLGPGGFGPWPWLGLSAAEALLIAWPFAIAGPVSRARFGPVFVAATFVLGEAVRDRFPVGGFPWARLAFTQPSGPLLPLASVAGAPLVTFAVALLGAGLARLVLTRRPARPGWVVAVAALVVPLVAGLALWPTIGNPEPGPRVRVAAIQGSGPNIGINLNYAGDVLWQRTVRQAGRTLQAIRRGALARPDIVVLPETVLDVRDTTPGGLAKLRRFTNALGVPTVAGVDVRDARTNSVVSIAPRRGLTGQYVKQHLVPFGEKVPLRWLARLVTPFTGSMSDLRAGDHPGVLPAGPAKVGVGVCYDVAYDDVLRGAVDDGANLLAVPTNNAWYGHSEMTYQQEAMSRVRAVEHDRAVVVSATTGVSAIIRPDGTIERQSGQFTPATVEAAVPLREHRTWADTLGSWPEWLLSAVGLAGLLPGIRVWARTRRAR